MTDPAYVALGSNLDDPPGQLRKAREQLGRLGRLVGASSLYRTKPVGGPPDQPDYLNAVVVIEPHQRFDEPLLLLRALQRIEWHQGRRRQVRWEARVLDLDLLAMGHRVVSEPDLVLPHPRILERPFVLAPLCEVAPEWRHPIHGVSSCDALARLPEGGVARTELAWGAG